MSELEIKSKNCLDIDTWSIECYIMKIFMEKIWGKYAPETSYWLLFNWKKDTFKEDYPEPSKSLISLLFSNSVSLYENIVSLKETVSIIPLW